MLLFCINRNILECKCVLVAFSLWLNNVLIETYWNVNTDTGMTLQKTALVLIETYWNVNI